MDGSLPILFVDVADHDVGSLVDADANDLDFVTPISCSLLKHIFIVLHRCLARRAPSSPEVYQPNLASFVFKSHWLSAIDRNDAFDRLICASGTNLALNFDLNVLDSLGQWFDFFLESSHGVLHFRWE